MVKWEGLPKKPCPELPFSPQHLVWHCFPLTRICFKLLFTSASVCPCYSHIFSALFCTLHSFSSRRSLLFLADHLRTAHLDLGHNFCRERKTERIWAHHVWAVHCLIQYSLSVWVIFSVDNFYQRNCFACILKGLILLELLGTNWHKYD